VRRSGAHALALAALFTLGACRGGSEIDVRDAYVERAVPGTSVSAGYFDMQNHGDAAIALIGASCDAARAIELHEHVLDGDMMRMRKLDSVSIGAGERVTFAPGGRHLMIFDLDPNARSPVVIRFTFADHAPVAVEFAVRDRAGADG